MIRWMRQVLFIARNTFSLFTGDPMIFIVNLFIILSTILIACLPGFAFGEQLRLIRDEILALTFICCCLAATIGAANNVSDDIRRGMVPVLMSRPVDSGAFIWGKWLGIIMGMLLLMISSAVSFLWISRIIAVDGALETLGLSTYFACIFLALVFMTVKHFLFRGAFVFQSNIFVTFIFLCAFLLVNIWGYNGQAGNGYGYLVNWITLKAYVFIYMAIIIFTAIQIFLAVNYDQAILMASAVIIFFLGLFLDYFLHAIPVPVLQNIIQIFIPNWQTYWIAEDIAENHPISTVFVTCCLFQAIGQSILFLVLAGYRFKKQEYQGGI